MAKCKLCLKERKLRNSHIIPEFMYSRIYDKNPKRYYEIKVEGKSTRSRIEQKGKREYLLCGSCEGKLSKYEKYMGEVWYGKGKNGTASLVKSSLIEDCRLFVYECAGLKYNLIKLFLDSLLWRLLISEKIKTPKYSEEVMEKLRLAIYNETPLDENEFPCLMRIVLSAPKKILKGFILSPIERKSEGSVILSVLIDGLEYNFYISGEFPDDEVDLFLKKNGELKIIGMLIHDIPDLIKMLDDSMSHLTDRLGKG